MFDLKWIPGMTWEWLKKWALKEALERFGGNQRKAADALGISIRTVRSSIKKWKLWRYQRDGRL